MEKTNKSIDWILLIFVVILVLIGFMMVFSSSYPDGYYNFNGNGFYFFEKQLIAGIIGIVAMFIASFVNYKIYRKLSGVFLLFSIIAGISLFTAYGTEANGAQRWISIGPLTLQPSEIIKVSSIIYLAYLLEKKNKVIHKFKDGFIPIVFWIVFFGGLIVIQKDLSTSMVLVITLGIMYFVAGANLFYIFISLGLLGGVSYYLVIQEQYRIDRVVSFIDPFKYKQTLGWQVVQSLYAFGTGGLIGTGLGQSRQKFFYIPEPYNDFIFSIIGEEVGYIGAILVIVCYIIVIWRGLRISINADDLFGSYIATGLTSLIGIQAFIHIAVVTSSMPPTGIALPFISAGGTSLVILLGSIGVLLNISKYAEI
jgi:cell division protein FtsW